MDVVADVFDWVGGMSKSLVMKYASEKDGLMCVRCGRGKGSHNKRMECLPEIMWKKIK